MSRNRKVLNALDKANKLAVQAGPIIRLVQSIVDMIRAGRERRMERRRRRRARRAARRARK